MDINQVLAVLNNVAPQLRAVAAGNPAAGDFEVNLQDGGTIQFDGDDHGWSIRGYQGIGFSSGIKIAEIKTEQQLAEVVRRSYVPQMAVYQVMNRHLILLPAENQNFFWDFLYYASWKLFGTKDSQQREENFTTVKSFLATSPPQIQKAMAGYFTRFKLEAA